MNIRSIDGPSDMALARFEAGFHYPLGPGTRFSISHGADYTRFFRSLGESRCWLAEQDGAVVAALSAAVRRVRTPWGDRPAVYLGDLKVDAAHRGRGLHHRLFAEAAAWVFQRSPALFAVVMDDTARIPPQYTGRDGIPRFERLRGLAVFQLGTDGPLVGAALPANDGPEIFDRLTSDRCSVMPGSAADRSELDPQWLATPDALACGRLEDTRKAKRLFRDDGTEIMAAHLSCFAFRTPAAGRDLIDSALTRASAAGFPSLLTAIDEADAAAFENLLGDRIVQTAPATIYGVGFEPGIAWTLHSSEI